MEFKKFETGQKFTQHIYNWSKVIDGGEPEIISTNVYEVIKRTRCYVTFKVTATYAESGSEYTYTTRWAVRGGYTYTNEATGTTKAVDEFIAREGTRIFDASEAA